MNSEKGQVIYFPTTYVPNFIRRTELKMLQAEIRYCNTAIYNQSKNRFEEVCRIQALANKLRDKWEVIDGGKNTEYKDKVS